MIFESSVDDVQQRFLFKDNFSDVLELFNTKTDLSG